MSSNWLIVLFGFVFLPCALIHGKPITRDGIGKVVGDRFQNDRFHLSVAIPKGWYVMTEDDLRQLMGSFAAGETIIPVFGLSTYRVGSRENNSNIIALAAEGTNELNLCTPLVASRGLVSLIFSTTKYKDECREIVMNGKRFGFQELSMQIGSSNLSQSQYVFRTKDDYFITFTQAYFDDDDKAMLDQVMSSLSFSM